jgi:hypothetical protein
MSDENLKKTYTKNTPIHKGIKKTPFIHIKGAAIESDSML